MNRLPVGGDDSDEISSLIISKYKEKKDMPFAAEMFGALMVNFRCTISHEQQSSTFDQRSLDLPTLRSYRYWLASYKNGGGGVRGLT